MAAASSFSSLAQDFESRCNQIGQHLPLNVLESHILQLRNCHAAMAMAVQNIPTPGERVPCHIQMRTYTIQLNQLEKQLKEYSEEGKEEEVMPKGGPSLPSVLVSRVLGFLPQVPMGVVPKAHVSQSLRGCLIEEIGIISKILTTLPESEELEQCLSSLKSATYIPDPADSPDGGEPAKPVPFTPHNSVHLTQQVRTQVMKILLPLFRTLTADQKTSLLQQFDAKRAHLSALGQTAQSSLEVSDRASPLEENVVDSDTKLEEVKLQIAQKDLRAAWSLCRKIPHEKQRQAAYELVADAMLKAHDITNALKILRELPAGTSAKILGVALEGHPEMIGLEIKEFLSQIQAIPDPSVRTGLLQRTIERVPAACAEERETLHALLQTTPRDSMGSTLLSYIQLSASVWDLNIVLPLIHSIPGGPGFKQLLIDQMFHASVDQGHWIHALRLILRTNSLDTRLLRQREIFVKNGNDIGKILGLIEHYIRDPEEKNQLIQLFTPLA